MSKKKLTELEQQFGVMALDETKYPLDSMYTIEEFRELLVEHTEDFKGVQHNERKQFLERNGYALTRENFTNVSLPANVKP